MGAAGTLVGVSEQLNCSGISYSRQVPGFCSSSCRENLQVLATKVRVHFLGAIAVVNVLQGRARLRAGWEVASDQRFGGKPPPWKPCRKVSRSGSLVPQWTALGQAFVIPQTAGAPVRLPVGSGGVRLEFEKREEEPGEGLVLLKINGPACHICSLRKLNI